MKQHFHINVSYPYEGNFELDNTADRVVGHGSIGSGCGSFMMSFSGAESGIWRDREYIFVDERTSREIMDELTAKLKAEEPTVDWRVTEMPHG